METEAAEMRQIFLEEMAELLEDSEQDLLSLEQQADNPEIIHRLFRNLHTLKGGARMSGMEALAHYTHSLETMLDGVRQGTLPLTAERFSLLLEAVDLLWDFRAEAQGQRAVDRAAVQDILNKIVASGAVAVTQASRDAGALMAPRAPQPPSPAPASPSLASPKGAAALREVLFHLFCPPDQVPEQALLVAGEAALQEIGRTFAITHAESFEEQQRLAALGLEDSPQTRDDVLFYSLLWVGTAPLEQALQRLAPWTERYRLEVTEISGLPPPPEHQAVVDADCGGLLLPEAAAADSVAVLPPSAGRMRSGADHGHQKLASIRVDIEKLDRLVNLVGELITVEARLDSFMSRVEERDGELAENLHGIHDDNSRSLRELQDQVMTIRMIPIGGAFDPMSRLVRDYCHETGKQVSLVISGRETEVDKKVFEQISGPLKHLVRNALDHGLETPAERLAAGKPAVGELYLSAYHQYGLMVIEVADDGRGIDLDRVLLAAQEKGLVEPNRDVSEREVLDLIFAPAVTTAREVTEVSGRGVGMDVVRRDIEALRGSVEVATALGEGTLITIRIPLTLSIIEGLLVCVGENTYVIPLSSVEECVELPLAARMEGDQSQFLDLRGELVPYLRLRDLFSVSGEPPPYEKVVIVSTGEQRVGLMVDHIIGDHQAVIKPLGKLFRDVACFSGATILGDGQVVLILDVLHLVDFGQSQQEALRQ